MSGMRRMLLFTKLKDKDMSEFKFINGVTLTEEAESITINLDTDGNGFELKDYYIEACIVNKNADNTDLSGWKVTRLKDGGGYWSYVGTDAIGNSLPAINQSLYIWCHGLYLGNDGVKDCYKVETYTSPYNNGTGATLLPPKIYKNSGRSRTSVVLTTACQGWKLGVGSFLNVYGRI